MLGALQDASALPAIIALLPSLPEDASGALAAIGDVTAVVPIIERIRVAQGTPRFVEEYNTQVNDAVVVSAVRLLRKAPSPPSGLSESLLGLKPEHDLWVVDEGEKLYGKKIGMVDVRQLIGLAEKMIADDDKYLSETG